MRRVLIILAAAIVFLIPSFGVVSDGNTEGKTFSGAGIVVVQGSTTTMSVEAPGQPVNTGSQFIVAIMINTITAIGGGQFDLSFDPTVLQIISVAEGNMLKQNGTSSFFIPGIIDNVNGQLSGVAGVVLGSGQSVSGVGILANITFSAVASGTSQLKLSNVIVGGTNAESLPVSLVDGQVVVN